MPTKILGMPVVDSKGEKVESTAPIRVFGCATSPNTRFQIVEGDPKDNQPILTTEGPIYNERKGDKYVEFSNGLFATSDLDAIRWCEAQYPKVVDMEEPGSGHLITIAKLQTPTQAYEPESTADILTNAGSTLKNAIESAVAKARAEWEEGNGSGVSNPSAPTASTTPIAPAGKE